MVSDLDALLRQLQEALEAAGVAKQPLCVALSGGMDSMVLLHALVALRATRPLQLSAIHVNHGLSPQANQWAQFCRSHAEALKVPCAVMKLQPLQKIGVGLERAAREARYAAFAQVAAPVLCLAHHQNDLAETLLLNLFRGAGAQGLAAMPATRHLAGKTLIRPWLDVPRSQLHDWATAHGLDWIEDESNQDLHFRRNYVRQTVLPSIGVKFSGVIRVLARTAVQMQEQAALLARLAQQEGAACSDDLGKLSVAKLAELPPPAVRNVLKSRLNRLGVQIPAAKRLETLAKQLVGAREDAEIQVAFGAVDCYVWRDRLWLDTAAGGGVPAVLSLHDGTSHWASGTLTVTGVKGDVASWVLKPIGSGQRFQPAGRCRDAVSELLRAQGVPPWERPRLPALWWGDTLCWIAQLGWADDAPRIAPLMLAWQPQPPICL